MCARVCVDFCAHVSSMWNNIAGGRGVCAGGDETVNSGKEKKIEEFLCVYVIYVLFCLSSTKIHCFLFASVWVCACACFGLMFIHLDTWRLCVDLFSTQSLFSSLSFSALRFSLLLFFIVIITFCIDFAQFPPKWCTRLVCSVGIWLSHFEISCIYFVCYGCWCRRRCYTQTIPGRLACLDGFLFLCQYEHNL